MRFWRRIAQPTDSRRIVGALVMALAIPLALGAMIGSGYLLHRGEFVGPSPRELPGVLSFTVIATSVLALIVGVLWIKLSDQRWGIVATTIVAALAIAYLGIYASGSCLIPQTYCGNIP